MNEKTKTGLMLLLKVSVVVVLMTAIILNYNTLTNLDVRAIVENAGSIYMAIGIVIAIFFGKSLLFVIPASLIYVSVGMAFSAITAIIVSLIGIATEVSATYILGRFLGGDTVNKLLSKSKNGKKLLEKEVQNKFSIIFIMRFTGLPIDFTSLFLGASGCNYLKYLLASLAGIMPRVILFTFLGDSIYNLIPMKYVILAVICVLPIVAIIFLIRHFSAKNKNKEENTLSDTASKAE